MAEFMLELVFFGSILAVVSIFISEILSDLIAPDWMFIILIIINAFPWVIMLITFFSWAIKTMIEVI